MRSNIKLMIEKEDKKPDKILVGKIKSNPNTNSVIIPNIKKLGSASIENIETHLPINQHPQHTIQDTSYKRNLIINSVNYIQSNKGRATCQGNLGSHTNKKIIAVIPAHNESKYISDVVKTTMKHVDEVIVVDDASTDNTKELAEKAGAIVLKHPLNLHKGASLKTGCELAIKRGADIIITLDGDGQHDPEEIPKLINKLKEADIVLGARAFDKSMPKTSILGNIILSKLSNFLFKTKISDSQTGYRAFNTTIYQKIKWESADYGAETEVIKKIHDNNIKYTEVKVKTIYNDKYKGTTPLDGLRIAKNMIGWRMKK